MKKSITAAIAVLVVILVIIVGLYYAGILKIQNQNNGSSSYAPNVVSTSEVSKSLGGTWTRSSSGYGTSGNVSSFFNLLGGGISQPITVMDASAGHSGSPQAIIASAQDQPYENISAFEFSVYSPNHAGFAAVGYATLKTSSDASNTFTAIYSNVTSSSETGQFTTKGSVSGNEYVYHWAYLSNTSLTPSNQNESILIGIYGSSIIGIFYLTPSNLSLDNFTSLYLDQISKMSSITNPASIAVFVSSATVGSNIGGSWQNNIGIDVQIQNATSILHEFFGSLSNSSSLTKADVNILNQTVGNLSEIGLQAYSYGSMNSTVIGFAKFLNDKVPFAIYLAAVAYYQNATNGQISSDNISYIYYHSYIPGYYYNATYNYPGQNDSLLFADYNDYVIGLLYSGSGSSAAPTQTQFVNLLKAEVRVVLAPKIIYRKQIL